MYQAYIFRAINYSKSSYTGQGVKVALIDSGVNRFHEDINNKNIHETKSFVKGEVSIEDQVGHGTFIAGMLSAQVDNGIGIVGLVPDVEIFPLKCFGDRLTTDIDTVIKCVEEAIRLGVDVINISLTTPIYSVKFEKVIQEASKAGIIIIAPSGNDKSGVLYYPAAFEEVVSVNALHIERTSLTTRFSTMSNHNEHVDIAAPGDNILGIDFLTLDGYTQRSGSSYACVFITAAAVMLKQLDKGIGSKAFKELIKKTARPLDDIHYGVIDFHKLQKSVKGQLKVE